MSADFPNLDIYFDTESNNLIQNGITIYSFNVIVKGDENNALQKSDTIASQSTPYYRNKIDAVDAVRRIVAQAKTNNTGEIETAVQEGVLFPDYTPTIGASFKDAANAVAGLTDINEEEEFEVPDLPYPNFDIQFRISNGGTRERLPGIEYRTQVFEAYTRDASGSVTVLLSGRSETRFGRNYGLFRKISQIKANNYGRITKTINSNLRGDYYIAIPGPNLDSYLDHAESWSDNNDNWAFENQGSQRTWSLQTLIRDVDGNPLRIKDLPPETEFIDPSGNSILLDGTTVTTSQSSREEFDGYVNAFITNLEDVYNDYLNLLQESDSILRSLREFISDDEEPEIVTKSNELRDIYIDLPPKLDRIFNIQQIYLRYGVEAVFNSETNTYVVLCTNDDITYNSTDTRNEAIASFEEALVLIQDTYETFKQDYRKLLDHLEKIIIAYNISRQSDLIESFSNTSPVASSRARHGLQFSEGLIPPELKEEALQLIETSRSTTLEILETYESDIISDWLPDEYNEDVLDDLINKIIKDLEKDLTSFNCP